MATPESGRPIESAERLSGALEQWTGLLKDVHGKERGDDTVTSDFDLGFASFRQALELARPNTRAADLRQRLFESVPTPDEVAYVYREEVLDKGDDRIFVTSLPRSGIQAVTPLGGIVILPKNYPDVLIDSGMLLFRVDGYTALSDPPMLFALSGGEDAKVSGGLSVVRKDPFTLGVHTRWGTHIGDISLIANYQRAIEAIEDPSHLWDAWTAYQLDFLHHAAEVKAWLKEAVGPRPGLKYFGPEAPIVGRGVEFTEVITPLLMRVSAAETSFHKNSAPVDAWEPMLIRMHVNGIRVALSYLKTLHELAHHGGDPAGATINPSNVQNAIEGLSFLFEPSRHMGFYGPPDFLRSRVLIGSSEVILDADGWATSPEAGIAFHMFVSEVQRGVGAHQGTNPSRISFKLDGDSRTIVATDRTDAALKRNALQSFGEGEAGNHRLQRLAARFGGSVSCRPHGINAPVAQITMRIPRMTAAR